MALKMTGANSYDAFKQAGWTDAQMVAHGYAVMEADKPISVRVPLAALDNGLNHIPAGNTVNRRLLDAGIPTVGHFGVLYVTRGMLAITLDGDGVLYQWKP